jgi:hypothetical protein
MAPSLRRRYKHKSLMAVLTHCFSVDFGFAIQPIHFPILHLWAICHYLKSIARELPQDRQASHFLVSQ